MPNININSTNCFFEHKYNGCNNKIPETLVFIHGAGGNHKFWFYQTKDLNNEFITIAPDLPGHGKSEGKALNHINDYSSYINKFIELTVEDQVYLVGHSMGGAIAMQLALNNPKKIKGLILIGTGPRLKVAPQILETFGSGQHFLDLINLFYRKNPSQTLLDLAKKDILSTKPQVWFADFTACNNFDITDRLAKINIPTLIIGANEDMLTPLKFSKTMVQNIPQARLEVIKGAGHMMMLEKPERVNQVISTFIRENN